MEPLSVKPPEMPSETKLERRLNTAVARGTTPRGAAIVIAAATIAITVGAGILMTVADRQNFGSIGSGLWWAVQTTTTVGYGDQVPTTVAGRLVAALVMLFGIGFLTIITAAITSTFVSRSRLEQRRSDAKTPTAEQFRQFDGRLERIEAALTRPS
jgi:voltage-gated potassium channel